MFQVHTGKVVRSLIKEITKTITYFNNPSALEEVAITMTMNLLALLLQKPSRKSKTKEYVA